MNSVACSWMAVTVAFVGHVEKLLVGCGGLPVNELRETTLSELAIGLGALNDKSLLPSAYDMWQGPRSSGMLRVRYTYNVDRLRNYSVSTLLKLPLATVEPLALGATLRMHSSQLPTKLPYSFSSFPQQMLRRTSGYGNTWKLPLLPRVRGCAPFGTFVKWGGVVVGGEVKVAKGLWDVGWPGGGRC